MADGATFTQKSNGIKKNLEGKLTRARTVQSYLNTVVVRQYIQAQIKRWQTENASEGSAWAQLSPKYLAWKKKKFANSPGGGNAILYATGKLANAAMLRDGGTNSYKIVTSTGIEIGISDDSLKYAKWVAQKRPFMQFSRATIAEMRKGISDYIRKGQSWRAS